MQKNISRTVHHVEMVRNTKIVEVEATHISNLENLTNPNKCDIIITMSESMLSISQFSQLIGKNNYSEKEYVSMKTLIQRVYE